MSEGNVVRRNPKNRQRKNTDGYRTDSGCFEDVDLQMANQNFLTRTSSEPIVEYNDTVPNDASLEEQQDTTGNDKGSPIPPSLADECADDKDFHAILKKLSDITTNPGDLYRLCFSSRLSYCGHISGNAENEESLHRTDDVDQNGIDVLELANACTNCDISNESGFEEGEKCTKRLSHGHQCAELLSLLSSFANKAKENPSMFRDSSLGNSLVAQLSSLLSTLEESKGDDQQLNEEDQSISTNQQISDDGMLPHMALGQLPAHRSKVMPASNETKHHTPLSQQDSNGMVLTSKDTHYTQASLQHKRNNENHFPPNSLFDMDVQNRQLLPSNSKDELEIELSPSADTSSTHFTNDYPICDAGLKVSMETQKESPLPISSLKASCATSLHSGLDESYTTSKHSPSNQEEQLNLKETSLPHSSPRSSCSAKAQKTESDNIDSPSTNKDESQSLLYNVEDTNGASEADVIDGLSSNSSSSVTDDGDVVTNGRRAVKPYSWDYGDIWEKELEKAKSSESFRNTGHEGQSKDPVKDMFQSFEEIRDDLFYNAGFVYENSRRSDGAKRRSRSADARSSLQDNTMWRDYYTTQSDVHSPFVRTVYQDEERQSTGMRRSWSSQHIGGSSVMVNVNWTNGRQMRVITGPAGRGFDDVRAQIIKEAAVKTSTFRGPKPWSVLKRRPSGLRRRPGRSDLGRSKKNEESCVKLEQDSESSDSPYVSASSSDCLTTTTDESSSLTSLQHYASSSLPSSPSVSNRSSACFSDTSAASDASDIRRVVFQKTASSLAPREFYSSRFTTRGMTLDQRFGFIHSHDRLSSNGGLEDNLDGLHFNSDHDNNSENLRRHSSTLPRKFHGNHLVSPLLVRSHPDLNRLTKVQFVGDSYSRSRISKNVRYTRNGSQSPSPIGPRSAHTRVVSCEIVQSDNKKRDVYTKVNISESLDDEEENTSYNSRNTKLGQPSTRQSWHGHTPTRSYPRQNLTNTATTQGKRLPRYSLPSRLAHQQGCQLDKPVHAKLISVNNHQNRMHTHWSTGSLQQPAWEKPRLLSDSTVPNRPRRITSMKSNSHPPSFERNVSDNKMINSGRAPAPAVPLNSGRRRSPPDYLTAVKQSKVVNRHSNPAQFFKTENHLTNTDKPVTSNRHSLAERINKPRETMQPHCAKEKSFPGPSNSTKSQTSSDTHRPSSEPSFSRTRRSRSLNEKDTVSRRRLHDSDTYRKRAMEINQNSHGESDYMMYSARYNADAINTTNRSERRRRYSDGGTSRPTRHNLLPSDSVVEVPRPESTPEPTFSVANAESVKNEGKSDNTSETYQPEGQSCAPSISHSDNERTVLQTSGSVNRNISNNFDQSRMAQSIRKFKESTNYGHCVTGQSTDSKCNSTTLPNRSDIPLCSDTNNRNSIESKSVVSSNVQNVKATNCTVVPLISRQADDETNTVIMAQFPFDENTDENKTVVQALTASPAEKKVEEERKFISTAELQLKNKNRSGSFENLSYKRNNTTLFHQEIFPHKQVDEVDRYNLPPSRHDHQKTDDENSIISTNSCVPSSSLKTNSMDLGQDISKHKEDETSVILSPILPNRKPHDKSSEVNVFIDYRSKRPVSVEYSEEDVSFLKTLGTTARKSRKGRNRGSSREFRVKTGRNNTSCTILDADVSSPVEQNLKIEDACHSRLSRKDKHEQEVLTSKVPSIRKDLQSVREASNQRPSPQPYRRDSTIIYTDARTSFGSDTDSVSRDSTISSSGSDMTVILHEDMDVSVDDLKQLRESGSKIGMEIAPIDMETGNEKLDDPDVVDEMPPAMKLSNTFENYQKRISGNVKVNPELVIGTESCNFQEHASTPENNSKNNTLKRYRSAKNNQNVSGDNLAPSSGSVQSSCSSIASSRGSSKSTGTEGSRGKLSTKNGGKGFFSRLKNIRNSLRVKKSDSTTFEKREKKSKNSKGDTQESEAFHHESDDISRQLTSSTDANANVVSKPRNRTMSHTRVMNTQPTQPLIARRSYDAFRHPNNNFRSNVVGGKSMSSDHLNACRISNTLHIDEATAKSLEVLVETCI